MIVSHKNMPFIITFHAVNDRFKQFIWTMRNHYSKLKLNYK